MFSQCEDADISTVLTQSYSKVHIHICDNVNCVILFKQYGLNSHYTYNNHVGKYFTFILTSWFMSGLWDKINTNILY